MGKRRKAFSIVLGVALLAWLSALAAPAAAVGPNLEIQVDEPFEVNGELYPAGMLQVKGLGDYSPTQNINELWLDNVCLGYLLARRAEAENAQAFTDSMFFTRSPEGHLVLAGYTVADGGAGELFRYQQQTGETAFNAASLR